MSQNDYYDDTFYLQLSLDKDRKIAVQRVQPVWDETQQKAVIKVDSSPISSNKTIDDYLTELSSIFRLETSSNEEMSASSSTLIKHGKKIIADVLLPNIKNPDSSDQPSIRKQFLEIWDYGQKKIRLCLLYSDEHSDDLLKIPWEYLYLHKKGVKKLDYFLGQRSDVSIVHCLTPDRYFNPNLVDFSRVNFLPFRLKYLSWFGSEANSLANEQHIYNSFIENVTPISELIESNSPKGVLPTTVDDHAEQVDFVIALRAQHFVQVSSHGDEKGIALKLNDKDDKVYPIEIENFSEEILEASKTKVVILLNCVSSSGGSLARKLHRIGIPIVLGITGSISIDAASRFVDGLYASIATWPLRGLEWAVSEGRKNILKKISGEWSTEFGYPRLFLNSPHSNIMAENLLYLPDSDKIVSGFLATISSVSVESMDQADIEKWQEAMTDWVRKAPGIFQRRWLLVTGPTGEGKTTQIKYLLKSLISKQTPCRRPENLDDEQTTPQNNKRDPDGDTPDSLSNIDTNSEEYPIPKIIFHLCDDKCPETVRALDFVRDSLVPQLICHYGDDYKEAIPKGRFPRLTHNADQALWDFVITPLEQLKREPVIVIDGLDFVPEFQDPENSILGLLFRNKGKLEQVARFLVSADYVELDPRDIGGQQTERPNEVSTNIYELTNHELGDKDIIEISPPDQASILFSVMEKRLKKHGLDLPGVPDGKHWQDFYTLLDMAVDQTVAGLSHHPVELEFDWRKFLLRCLNLASIAYVPLSLQHIITITNMSPPPILSMPIGLNEIFKPFLDQELSNTDAHFILFHQRLKNYFHQRMRQTHGSEDLAGTHALIVNTVRRALGEWADVDWDTLKGSRWRSLITAGEVQQDVVKKDPILAYVQEHLVFHAYYSCYYTAWDEPELQRKRADTFLNLICDAEFRKMRYNTVGHRMALQDIWLGLRIINIVYARYGAEAKDYQPMKARVAFDHLLEANRPNSFHHDELIKIERRLRENKAFDGKTLLFEFLNFSQDAERMWWKDVP